MCLIQKYQRIYCCTVAKMQHHNKYKNKLINKHFAWAWATTATWFMKLRSKERHRYISVRQFQPKICSIPNLSLEVQHFSINNVKARKTAIFPITLHPISYFANFKINCLIGRFSKSGDFLLRRLSLMLFRCCSSEVFLQMLSPV